MLYNGGNDKLTEFLDKFEVVKDTPILFKYNTKAAKRYREQLLASVSASNAEEPDLLHNEGSQLCDEVADEQNLSIL